MRYATPMFTRSLAFAAVLAVAVTAGCASKVTAPVRDGSGAASSAPRAPAAPPGTHIVRQGDTLLGIARQYGVTLPDLVVWNGITSPNQIRPGQSLRVAPPPADTTAAAVVTPIGGAAVSTPVQQPGAADTAAVTPRQDAPLTPPPPQAAPPAPPAESAAARARRWQWPARGPVIASFNDNTNKGVDIGGRVGDPVIAAAAGKVVYAGSGQRNERHFERNLLETFCVWCLVKKRYSSLWPPQTYPFIPHPIDDKICCKQVWKKCHKQWLVKFIITLKEVKNF